VNSTVLGPNSTVLGRAHSALEAEFKRARAAFGAHRRYQQQHFCFDSGTDTVNRDWRRRTLTLTRSTWTQVPGTGTSAIHVPMPGIVKKIEKTGCEHGLYTILFRIPVYRVLSQAGHSQHSAEDQGTGTGKEMEMK
jgi:hypothetical protein